MVGVKRIKRSIIVSSSVAGILIIAAAIVTGDELHRHSMMNHYTALGETDFNQGDFTNAQSNFRLALSYGDSPGLRGDMQNLNVNEKSISQVLKYADNFENTIGTWDDDVNSSIVPWNNFDNDLYSDLSGDESFRGGSDVTKFNTDVSAVNSDETTMANAIENINTYGQSISQTDVKHIISDLESNLSKLENTATDVSIILSDVQDNVHEAQNSGFPDFDAYTKQWNSDMNKTGPYENAISNDISKLQAYNIGSSRP